MPSVEILPALFDAEGQPLWLGRAARTASDAQRKLLAARDGGCIGCAAAPERCDAHHIEWWRLGGPTDIDNLCLLCPRCHRLVHEQHWQVHRQGGRYCLRPPPDRRNRAGPAPPGATGLAAMS